MIAGTSVTYTPTLLFQHTRRAMLAWLCREVRAAARRTPRPRVFALGDALGEMERRHPQLGIVRVGGTLADLMHGRVPRRSLALGYAADVVGYLDDELARAAVFALFRCVASGGRLLLASFNGAVGDAGYLSTCRDWCIVARDRKQMQYLIGRLPEEEIARVDQFHDEFGILSFTRVVRV